MYKSSLVDVGIAYTVWKSDKEDIDPTEWPFPPYVEEVNEKFSYFKSVNHIMIDTENLKGCWPTCVVLLSLYKRKLMLLPTYLSVLVLIIKETLVSWLQIKYFKFPRKQK
jgi:hypothetical protein